MGYGLMVKQGNSRLRNYSIFTQSSAHISDHANLSHFQAYQNWLLTNNLVEEPAMPGLSQLSGEQLFFLNFAQVFTQPSTNILDISLLTKIIDFDCYFC